MKKTVSSETRVWWLVIILTAFSPGCGKKHVNLTPASSVPAASATATLTHDSNGNTVVDLKVRNLAKPQHLTPPKSVYVVWIEPRGGTPVEEGELKVNNKLQGEFKTPTSYKTFDIFVTAEDSANVQHPTGQEVLRQTVTS